MSKLLKDKFSTGDKVVVDLMTMFDQNERNKYFGGSDVVCGYVSVLYHTGCIVKVLDQDTNNYNPWFFKCKYIKPFEGEVKVTKDVKFTDLIIVGENDGCEGCILKCNDYGDNCGEIMLYLTGVDCYKDEVIFKKKPQYVICTKENTHVGDEVHFYTDDVGSIVEFITDNSSVYIRERDGKQERYSLAIFSKLV